LQDGQRRSVKLDGDGYIAGADRLSAAELVARSETLSPNALLRPVVQDYLFPTAAYVGGPAELAYFAQNQVLYRALGVRPPLVLPRASATILDQGTHRFLADNDLRVPDLMRSQEAVRQALAAAMLPAERKREFIDARLAVARLFEETGHMRGLDRSRSKIEYQLAKVERRVARGAFDAYGGLGPAVAEACNLVYPAGQSQERLLTVLPFLARHGFQLIGRMREPLNSRSHGHHVVAC
jgi:uncharacterized protein YllA (UPF0747 family)